VRSLPALLILAALTAAAPARAVEGTAIAKPGAATALRSYAGWSAWQRIDDGRYVLQVRSPGGRITDRPETARVEDPLNPESEAIGFDLGPDAGGHPSLLVDVCAGGTCSLGIARLPAGRVRRIGGTAHRGHAASMTLWRGRVAWADGKGAVHLRPAAGTAPRVLAAWPARLCLGELGGGGCVARSAATVEELELRGRLLASVVHFFTKTQGGFDTARLELFDTTTGHRHVEDEVIAGEGGQTFLAPAFPDARTLSWLLTCTGDPGGCSRRMGVYRRDLRTSRVTFARDQTQREGWAPIGGRATLLGPGRDACGGETPGACAIRLRTLRFAPVAIRHG